MRWMRLDAFTRSMSGWQNNPEISRRLRGFLRFTIDVGILGVTDRSPSECARADPVRCFIAVNRYHRTPSVGMLEKMVAAFDANNLEPGFSQHFDQFRSGDGWKGAHAGTAIRCMPTNSAGSGRSTSRQSAIASLIRFISASSDLAWV